MANPPRALSDNILSITVTRAGVPATNATVVVSVVTPSGVTTLDEASVPHVAHGVYQYDAAPDVWPVDGTYTVTWHLTSDDKVLNRVEPVVVSR